MWLKKRKRGMKSSWDKKNTNSHTDSNITILIITSNVNGLNTQLKAEIVRLEREKSKTQLNAANVL